MEGAGGNGRKGEERRERAHILAVSVCLQMPPASNEKRKHAPLRPFGDLLV